MLDVSALLRASFPSLSSDLLEYATSFITDLSPDEPEYNATIKDFIVPFLEGESIAVEDSVIDNLCAELSKLNIPKGVDESPGISVEIIPQTIKNQQDSAHEHLEPTPEPEHSPAPEKKSTAKSKNPRTKAAKISKSQQQSESSFLNEPEIIVTTQVSRYYSETFDADTIELDLPGVSITINGKDLLAEARLRLKTGYKYGLIGRNGVGKSTLLRAIGEKSMIGFPKNIKTLYVEQEAIGDENTNVIQSVLDSDHERIRVLRESDALEKAMKESNAHISKIYRKLLAQRAEDERYRAWEIAEKRSGARGWDARKVLLEKEKLAVAAAKYAEEEVSMEVADEEAEKSNLLLNELYEKLTLIKAESTEAKVIEILNGLGFSKEKQTGPTSALSGGWRMRLSLARALFLKPDLLCLDEPTNHLDLPSVVWFQDYLKNHCDGQTVLIVSHDRAFMNEVIEEVILFQDMKLTYHSGNYDDFERNREERSLAKQKQQETLDRKMKHVEKSIENAMKSAVKSGDDKKLNQVSSRKKAIEKGRYGPTHFDDGKRFKQSYLAGYHDQFGLAIEQVKMEEEVNFKFPEPEPLRYLGPVLQVEGVSFKYKKSDPEFVLSNVTMNIERDCRIGIVGANGAGKSTLVNLILGKLTPTVGTVTKHANLITGLYSQHDTNLLPTDISALAHMQSLYPGVKEQELRGILGSLGLKGKLATNPIITLSGGQKTRVSFAKTVFKSPNLLVLDEPTNHLDIESIKGLVRALETFSGGVIVVSHDVRFLKDTCKVFYVVEKGRVKRWEASVEDYAKSLAKQKMFRIRVAGTNCSNQNRHREHRDLDHSHQFRQRKKSTQKNIEKGEKFEIDAKVSIKPPKENNKIYDPILEALKDPSVDLHQLFRKLLLVREALQNGNTYFITVSSYETRAIPKDYDIPLEFLTQSEVLVHVAESCGPFIEGVNGKIKLECKDLLPIITYLGFSWWKHIFRPNTPLTHNLDDLFASKINFDSVFEAINLSSYLELPGLTGICTKLAANNLRSIKSFEDMQTDDIVKILRSARIVDLYLCEERVDLDYWVTASVWKSNYLQILQSRNLKQHTNLELNVSDDPYSYKKKCVTFFLQEYLNHILINRDRKFSNEDILKICEIEKENIADFHLTVFIPKPRNTENFFNALNFWRIVLRTLDKIQQLSLTVTTENEVSLDQNELARIAEFLLEIKENVRGSVNIILLAKIEKLGGGEPEITQLEETTKKFNKFQSQEPAKVNTSFPSAHFETAKSYQSAAKLNASFGTKSIIFLEFSEKGLPLDIWNFLLHRLLDAGHQVSQLDFNRIVMSPESSKIISTTLFSKLNCSPIQNISNLSFSYCKIGGTATTNLCANILKASIILKSLNLAGNVSNYDPKAFIAGRAIAELCSSQLNITEINLSDNNFTIGGLGAIFQSLAQNRHLKKILVDNTNIGPCFHDFSRILISQDCKIMDISLARNGLLPRTLDTFFKDLKIAKKSVNVRKTAISVNLNENLFSRHFVQSFKTFVNVFQLREIYLRCSATFLAGSNSSNIEESFHEYEKNQDISAILSGCSSTKPNSVTQLSEDSLVEIFAMICNSCNSDTLTTLDVSYHRMGDKVAGSIPNLLKSCNQLRQLVLSGNTISDEGLQRLIEDMENCNGMHQNRMIEIDLRESVFISDDVKKMVAKWNFESLSGVLIRFD